MNKNINYRKRHSLKSYFPSSAQDNSDNRYGYEILCVDRRCYLVVFFNDFNSGVVCRSGFCAQVFRIVLNFLMYFLSFTSFFHITTVLSCFKSNLIITIYLISLHKLFHASDFSILYKKIIYRRDIIAIIAFLMLPFLKRTL